MAEQKKRLRQYRVKEYAGPFSEMPAELPFGDYYFDEENQDLYKYNYNKVPILIGNNGSDGPTIYTSDGSIVGSNRTVTINDLGNNDYLLKIEAIGSSNKESSIQVHSEDILLKSNFNGQVGIEITDTEDNTTFLSSAGLQITNSDTKLLHEVGDGGGNTVSESSINISEQGIVILDSTNNTGIKYTEDYSANWGPRSLVDKEYVDNNSGGGGDTVYTRDGQIDSSRTITGIYGKELKFEMYDNGITTYLNRSEFDMRPDSIAITHHTGDTTGEILSETTLKLDSNQIIAQSNNENFEGIKYGGDYSSTFTERTLVDKEYVDNAISGSDTFYDGDGTISGTRTVTVDNYGSLQYFVYNGITSPDDGIGFFTLDYESFQLGWQDTASGIVRSSFSWVPGVGFELEDDNLQLGIRYREDYSANWGPRSLVDKEYVDNNSGGPGDMTKAIYDPNEINGDIFNMDLMAEGVTNKILTESERSNIATNNDKISYTDSAAVSLNTAKVGITSTQSSNIDTNNSKISYTDSAAVALNTAKIGITSQQAIDIATNNTKISGIDSVPSQASGSTSQTATTSETLIGLDTIEIDGSNLDYAISTVDNNITFTNGDGVKIYKVSFSGLINVIATGGATRSIAKLKAKLDGLDISYSEQWEYIREWQGSGNGIPSTSISHPGFFIRPAIGQSLDFVWWGETAAGQPLTNFSLASFSITVQRIK